MKTSLGMIFLTYLLTFGMAVPQRYDHFNIDQILNNQRLYKKYFDCLANIGKCTPEGRELKELLPGALASDCASCNERQKEGAEKVLKFMIENKPEDFSVLEKIYDPDGSYRKKYASQAEKYGVKLI